ncbi:family M13 non-peptidase homologue (M13 family) [Schistosoma mansoni]|uniref:family M13 non-peptidase homologue (M13 family) n=1 Tax=Schistosoma mansoni TaxID=6183 RepID=UPI00022DC341|nr:family M13 non-peptidase homologue (M13 family) [Schistosoma mansoni]|eukprot:XP_018650197.1 family M13 non-peptidase homologue (M13 family) [Schistosoma mansoni]
MQQWTNGIKNYNSFKDERIDLDSVGAICIKSPVIINDTNKSYALDDPHLSTTRKFYEACIKGPYDSNDHVRDQLRQLISMAFGEWDLLTSLSTNVTNTSKAARNILNLSLTDLYLPLISTTGHSPLFSLDIDQENRAIRNGVSNMKDMLYVSADSLNMKVSQYSKLHGAFQLFDRLVNAFLDPQTSTPFKTNQSVSIEELKAICPPYPINAEDHVLNEYYAQKAMYTEKLRRRIKKAGKTSLRDSPTYLPEAYYLTNLNRMHIFAGLMQPPFYEKDEDSPTRYIGLGWIIAHEFMHAIDIIGVLEDFNGNQRLGRDSHAGMIANMKQTDCLRSHYKRHPDSFEKKCKLW